MHRRLLSGLALALLAFSGAPGVLAQANPQQNQERDRRTPSGEERNRIAPLPVYDSILLLVAEGPIEVRFVVIVTDEWVLGVDLTDAVRRENAFVENLKVSLFGQFGEERPPTFDSGGSNLGFAILSDIETFLIIEARRGDKRDSSTAEQRTEAQARVRELLDSWAKEMAQGNVPLFPPDLPILPGPDGAVDEIRIVTEPVHSTVLLREAKIVVLDGPTNGGEGGVLKPPALGGIPLLGSLFKKIGDAQKVESELIVLVTPRIVDSPGE